jgi:hypothetical protein
MPRGAVFWLDTSAALSPQHEHAVPLRDERIRPLRLGDGRGAYGGRRHERYGRIATVGGRPCTTRFVLLSPPGSLHAPRGDAATGALRLLRFTMLDTRGSRRRPQPKRGHNPAVPMEALRFRAMVCLFALMQKGTEKITSAMHRGWRRPGPEGSSSGRSTPTIETRLLRALGH